MDMDEQHSREAEAFVSVLHYKTFPTLGHIYSESPDSRDPTGDESSYVILHADHQNNHQSESNPLCLIAHENHHIVTNAHHIHHQETSNQQADGDSLQTPNISMVLNGHHHEEELHIPHDLERREEELVQASIVNAYHNEDLNHGPMVNEQILQGCRGDNLNHHQMVVDSEQLIRTNDQLIRDNNQLMRDCDELGTSHHDRILHESAILGSAQMVSDCRETAMVQQPMKKSAVLQNSPFKVTYKKMQYLFQLAKEGKTVKQVHEVSGISLQLVSVAFKAWRVAGALPSKFDLSVGGDVMTYTKEPNVDDIPSEDRLINPIELDEVDIDSSAEPAKKWNKKLKGPFNKKKMAIAQMANAENQQNQLTNLSQPDLVALVNLATNHVARTTVKHPKSHLTDEQRQQVIALRCQGLITKDISQRLNKPLKSVRHCLNQIRRKLMIHISQQCQEPGNGGGSSIVYNQTEAERLLSLLTPPQVKTQSSGRVHKCAKCDKVFLSALELRAHSQPHPVGDKNFACPTCKREFTTTASMRIHQREHTGNKAFGCLQCGKRFTSNGTLKLHETTHKQEPMRCSVCGKMFWTKDRFEAHVNMHRGVQPHICQVCGKAFAHAGDYKTHARIHVQGRQRFACDICGKDYSRLPKLREHQRVHEVDHNRTSCSVCGKHFALKHYLKIHMGVHTGKKAFQCQVCDRVFAQASSYYTHLSLHTDDKKYHCNKCGERFKLRPSMMAHKKKCAASQHPLPDDVISAQVEQSADLTPIDQMVEVDGAGGIQGGGGNHEEEVHHQHLPANHSGPMAGGSGWDSISPFHITDLLYQ